MQQSFYLRATILQFSRLLMLLLFVRRSIDYRQTETFDPFQKLGRLIHFFKNHHFSMIEQYQNGKISTFLLNKYNSGWRSLPKKWRSPEIKIKGFQKTVLECFHFYNSKVSYFHILKSLSPDSRSTTTYFSEILQIRFAQSEKNRLF